MRKLEKPAMVLGTEKNESRIFSNERFLCETKEIREPDMIQENV